MRGWTALAELARGQHGVVHVRQAEALGIPRRTVNARVHGWGWTRPQRGVLGLPGAPCTYERDVSAALLVAGTRALAAGWTAAHLWGLTDRRVRPVHIVVPRDRRIRPMAGVRVTRSGTLLASDARRARALAVTSVARTLCDVAAVTSVDELRELVTVAVQRRSCRLPDLGRRSAAMGSFPGSGRLRRVLAELDQDRTDSVLERRVRRLLRAAGVPPRPGVFPVVHDGRVIATLDIAYPAQAVGIEVDGFRYHATPAQKDRDDRRENALQAAGWRILRVSERRARTDADGFVRQLRAALAWEHPGRIRPGRSTGDESLP